MIGKIDLRGDLYLEISGIPLFNNIFGDQEKGMLSECYGVYLCFCPMIGNSCSLAQATGNLVHAALKKNWGSGDDYLNCIIQALEDMISENLKQCGSILFIATVKSNQAKRRVAAD